MSAARPGCVIESMTTLCNRIEDAVRAIVPADELRTVVSNIGLPG